MNCHIWQTVNVLLIFCVFGTQGEYEIDGTSEVQNFGGATLTFTNLHKCSCLANEVWFNGACQENSTTIQVLMDMHPSLTSIIQTNVIKNVEVSEIVCPQNYLDLTLPGESFALKTSGQLFNLNYELSLEFSKYCVEHFYDSERHEVDLQVHLCLAISKVPECCPEEHYDSFNKICNYDNSSEISVPFKLGRNLFEAETETFPNILKCHNEDNRTFVHLSQNESSAFLKLSHDGLELVHTVTDSGDRVFIRSPDYCVILKENQIVEASYCYEDLYEKHQKECQVRTCVRKCCPTHEIYDFDLLRCIPVHISSQWTPELYDWNNWTNIVEKPENIKLVVGFPLNCEYFQISPTTNGYIDEFKLMSNGSFLLTNWDSNNGLAIPPYEYCIDMLKKGDVYVEEAFTCFPEEIISEAVGCNQAKSILDPTLLLISCVFLAITLVVYAIIPDLHVKVQSKCLIANISSLLVTYIFLAVIQLASSNLPMGWCIAIGLLTQFSTLSSFFWLNIMCFDIWRTLRSMNTGRETKSSARMRYLKYSLYAWGCPIIITSVTTVMQTLNLSSTDTNLILPNIGIDSCFFSKFDTRIKWIYLYGFISVILIINLCFFIHLAFLLLKAQKISAYAHGKKNQLHKEWAKLYLKLFLIMGITWIFEVTSWIEGSCGFWMVTDIVNALRGLLIFIIFVCKRDIIKKLMKASSPAFQRVTTTMRQSSMFSRSSKRTSNFFLDPSTTNGTNEESRPMNHADVVL